MKNYPKTQEPVQPDLENSRFLYVGFYCNSDILKQRLHCHKGIKTTVTVSTLQLPMISGIKFSVMSKGRIYLKHGWKLIITSQPCSIGVTGCVVKLA